jgi:hypothetical protein
MPTDLQSIAQSDIRVRFKEPLLSEGVNKSQYIQPRGVYRGFNLGTSASALSVTVQTDPVHGDAVAVVHDADDRALTIRVTDPIDLDLTPFANKTVVVAIYARHVSQGSTVSVIRGYELSPVDEYTADINVGNLIVLGTVVVPAAGLIAETAITHEKRIVSGDNEFSQRVRIPLVLNHDFHQNGYPGNFYHSPDDSYEGTALPLGPHWFAVGGTADKEDTQYQADSTGLTIRSKSGSVGYSINVYQDIPYALGDISASNGDWKLHYEVVYDVLTVPVTELKLTVICAAPAENMADYKIEKQLDVSALGTGLVASGVQDLVTLPDSLAAAPDLGSAGIAYITSVQLSGDDAAVPVDTDVFKIVSVQLWLANNRKTAGHLDTQARTDKILSGWPIFRSLTFYPINASNIPIASLIDIETLPSLVTAGSSRHGSATVTALSSGAFVTKGSMAVESFLASAQRNRPRFRAEYDDVNLLTNILEAVSTAGDSLDSGLRFVASPSGLLYLTVNADPALGVWDKDVDGDPAAAIRIDGNTGELAFFTRAAGAGTWNDAAWTTERNLLTRGGVTAVITDGTTFTDGDHNGANAIDAVQNVYSRGRYFLRSGNHTLGAVSAITNNSTLIGESDPRVSSASKTYLFPNAGMVSDQTLETNLVNLHIRNGTAGRWSLSGSSAENCIFESGVVVTEFPALDPKKFVNCKFGEVDENANNAIAYSLEISTSSSDINGMLFENCQFFPPQGSSAGVAAVGITSSGESRDIGVTFRNCEFNGTNDVGANNGMAALVLSGDTRAVFENCTFRGGCDDVFMVQVLGTNHFNGVTFKNCAIENDHGKCMAIGGVTTDAYITLENVKMRANTSTPTSGKGQMFTFAGGGKLRMRDVRLLLNDSVIDTTAGPTQPPVEIGGVGGTGSTNKASTYDIDGLFLELDAGAAGVPTYTTLVVRPPSTTAKNSIRNVDYNVNGNAPANNGVGPFLVPAYMTFVGAVDTLLHLDNISLRGVDMPSHTDTRAGIYADTCSVNKISYDGPVSPTAAGGQLHNTRAALYFVNCAATHAYVGKNYNPNLGIGNDARLVYAQSSTLDSGIFSRLGVTRAAILIDLQSSSAVSNLRIAVSSLSGVTAVVNAASGARVANCLVFCSGTDPTAIVSGSGTGCAIVGNQFTLNGTLAFINLTGARCIVDGNMLYSTIGVPSITNSGTDSVTGDNVLS